MDEHGGHDTMVLRGIRGDGEHVWLSCLDCRALIRRVSLCGRITRKGKQCRSAVLDHDQVACRVHRDQ